MARLAPDRHELRRVIDEEREVVHDGKGTCIYEGWKLKGWPTTTVSRGRVVYEDGVVDPDASGHGICATRPDRSPYGS